jgi:hypothetical protein
VQPGLGRQIALDIARGLHFLHRHSVVGPSPSLPDTVLKPACVHVALDCHQCKRNGNKWLHSARMQVRSLRSL